MSELVFRSYTRSALDKEYDNQKKISDFQSYVDYCRRESAVTRQQRRGYLDISYGKGRAEKLDIFPSRSGKKTAVEIYFHGGYWRLLDKSDFSYVAHGFNAHDVMAVIVNYSLVPSVDLDTLIGECRAAVAWVFRNIERFGGDPERLFASGHSAGGHIAAMMLATDWTDYGRDLPREILKGATAISGLFDLEPMRHCFLADTLRFTPDQVARNSPVLLRPKCSAPLLLAVGGDEGQEYLRQSGDLAKAWASTACRPEMVVLANQNHFSIRDQLGDPASEMVSLMKRHWINSRL